MEQKLPEGLTVLKAETSGWDARRAAILESFMNGWATSWELPASRDFVFTVSIVMPQREDSIKRQLEELVGKYPAIPAAVIGLSEIEQGEAAAWARLPEVRRRYPSDRVQNLSDDIRDLYTAGGGKLPMRRLVRELPRLLLQQQDVRDQQITGDAA